MNTCEYLESSQVQSVRKNFAIIETNPFDSRLNTSRFISPKLKLTKIKSVNFKYRSPTKEQILNEEEKTSSPNDKMNHKIVVRKLPKFNHQIYEDEPMKNSKIIENIVFLREQQNNKDNNLMNSRLSRIKSNNTVIVNNQIEITKVPINLKESRLPDDLKLSRTMSASHISCLASSRLNIHQQVKTHQNLFNSIVREKQLDQNDFKTPVKQLSTFGSAQKLKEQNTPMTNFSGILDQSDNLQRAESQYFKAILGN